MPLEYRKAGNRVDELSGRSLSTYAAHFGRLALAEKLKGLLMITSVGVSYNVFNAEEHLISSISNIRNCVDYINVVVQYVSNQGLAAKSTLSQVIEELRGAKLVDEIITFFPDLSKDPVKNELEKRNIGLRYAKKASVSHFLTMDSDEYYPAHEFNEAKRFISEEGHETTAVRTYLHIRRPIYRSACPDITCCAFLTKLESESMIAYDDYYPVIVDPTRRLHGNRERFFLFEPETISMRHMNLVRNDLSWKLKNSTNAQATDFMRRVQEAYDNWEFGSDLAFPNKPPMQIIEVEDIFGIDGMFDQSESGIPNYLLPK